MNGLIVRSEGFEQFKAIGNPVSQLKRLSDWLADELVYIDITREGDHDIGRSDHKIKDVGINIYEILRSISKAAFMPLTFGGKIKSLYDVDQYIKGGADKVVINSQVYREPDLITRVANKYGSQAMMVGMDVKYENSRHCLYIDQGKTRVDDDILAYARRVEECGAGEILLNSIDRDGAAEGFDAELIRKVSDAVSIPVIACGGAGAFSDFCEIAKTTEASAFAAGNIFHFTEHSYKRAKKKLLESGCNVRYPYIN